MAGPQIRLMQAGRPSRERGGNSRFYVLLAVLLPAGLVLLPSFIVLVAAMVPTIVAWMVDRTPGRYLAATVGALNFAGSLYFLGRLWSWQHDLSTALEVMSDVFGWLVAYGAAAAGYGVYYAMPGLTRRIAELKAQHRLSRLERNMQDLVEEWGEPVSKPPAE